MALCEDSLQQCCPAEHSTVMETVYNFTIQHGSHMWASELLNVASEPKKRKFILINSNLNSPM